MGNEKLLLGIVIGVVAGACAGYLLGSYLTMSSINAQIAEQQSANTKAASGAATTNPLQDVQTNPYDNIKTNPFN